LTINTSSAANTIIGAISGATSLVNSGSGTLTLSGNNTYTGSTTVLAGTLNVSGTLSDSTALTVESDATYIVAANDTIASIAGAGNITLTANLTAGATPDTIFSGVISGAGNLTKQGTGTLTLSGPNTYTGTTTLRSGTLSISADNQLGAIPGTATVGSIIFNGGTLNTSTTFMLNANRGIAMTGNGTIDVDGSTTLTYNGVIAGSGDLTKSGAGTLVLGGANTYTGTTLISSGALTVSGNLADVANITVASGAIYNLLNTDTIATISGSGIVNLGANLTVGFGDQDFSFGGSFTGTGSLIKTGLATMTLSGSSSYTGNTVLNASQLILANADALGLSTLVSAAGVLQLADGIVLSSLHVTGPIKITNHIQTIGDQLYEGDVVIAPNAGVVTDMRNYAGTIYTASGVKLSSTNGGITFNGKIDAQNAKSESLSIDAGTGTVTVGNSVGSITPLQNLYIVGENIKLLADVLTGQEQTYVGTTTIGSNGSAGFLYEQFVKKTRPESTFSIQNPIFTRTFISTDPTVRFVGTVNPDSTGYSLLVAAIYDGFVNGDPTKEPRIIFDGLVGNLIPFYSTNFQALQAGDVFMLGGKISTMGVKTISAQNYTAEALEVLLDPSNSVATFRSSQPGTINFDLSKIGGQMNMGSAMGVIRVIIDGLTNFTGAGVGLAAVSLPVQEAAAAAAAAAAAGGGNLMTTAQFNKQFVLRRDALQTSSVTVLMDENVSNQDAENKLVRCRKGDTECE
ncbi:autotransporter-associated beta strand protein, partial [Polynucleobacter brandtiae]